MNNNENEVQDLWNNSNLNKNITKATRDELEVMTVKTLKTLAKNCGVKSRGNKKDLVDRIYTKISQ